MSLNRRIANLGNVIDSATTGHFLSKGDSDGQFSTVAYSSISGTPTVLDSALTSQLVDSSYIQLRQTTSAAGLDSALITTLVDSSYVAARAGSGGGGSGFVKYQYTATNNQTTFQDSDDAGQILSYTEDYILVHYNGVTLPASDYTASSGSSVVLGTGADSAAIISIAKWSAPSSGGGSSTLWYGDRAIVSVGETSGSSSNIINYFDITSTGNASDFGDLSAVTAQHTAAGSSSRTIFKLGLGSGTTQTMEYVTPSTLGNTTDFGDTSNNGRMNSAVADGTYMLIHGGNFTNDARQIEYVTIATPGNASDFGDTTVAVEGTMSGGDATRAIHKLASGGVASTCNVIEYTTMATPGNATDFGNDATDEQALGGACSGGTTARFVWSGGRSDTIGGAQINNMTYVAVQTLGNSTDFGDLQYAPDYLDATSNFTRGVVMGGRTSGSAEVNNINYFAFDTTGNATDFGDLANASQAPAAGSGAAA